MDIALALCAYLLLVSVAVALLMLPALRRNVSGWTRRRAGGGGRALSRAVHAVSACANALGGRVTRASRRVSRWNARLWSLAVALLLALAGPALLALWLGSGRWLEGYDDTTRTRIDPHIAALLQGEQLVPPEPLPPETFSTREAEAQRPLLASASREWAALDADFRQRLLLVFKLMDEQHGYRMVLLEGYRSPQRQALLRNRGPQVTRAGANESYHQFGLAADCAFYRDGQLVISEQDAWARRGYELYGQVAESVGLVWGGRWSSIVDLGHVELHRSGTGTGAR